jgi:hypothetical protein
MNKAELQKMYDERKLYYHEGSGYELYRLSCYMAGKVLAYNHWDDGPPAEDDAFMAGDTKIRALADMFAAACEYVASELAEDGKDIDTVRYTLIKAIQDIKSVCREIGISINFKEGLSRSGDPSNIVFEVNIKHADKTANTDLWVNVAQEKLIDEIFKELSSLLYHILKAMGKKITADSFAEFKNRTAEVISSLESKQRAL